MVVHILPKYTIEKQTRFLKKYRQHKYYEKFETPDYNGNPNDDHQQ